MKWLLYERDFYWRSPEGHRSANRPRDLSPEHYTLVSYWRPRWRWLQRLLRWEPEYNYNEL
jgi:hypothetical protein